MTISIHANSQHAGTQMSDLEQAIRERAYQLWQEGGHQEATPRHWLEAQREILAASLASVAHVSKVMRDKMKTRKKRRAA
ncbi:DUF2934 domain-containing protein [Bradyrhizobium sp. CB2312]|uniref:DUF2934 domain-containing protein n=1 Tax=Bradyrhizobium sp. CB2312 TaxID=3039155 RepID=UPI0024B186AE|nr:DUF2934 domain-containing protein [Bradyrhizobium sp. CB2312]WFU69186.1 DUF2934 domain-containing protein [Bradyrhizobium sp. CB2312]